MNHNELRKLAGLPLIAEAVQLTERYSGSHEFDSDISKVDKLLKDAKKILTSANFKQHMFDTDHNYSTEAMQMTTAAVKDLDKAINSIDELYTHIIDASE
jgi:hypothetical protein